MQLTQELYRWLKGLEIVNHAEMRNSAYELDRQISDEFSQGMRMGLLLDKLQGQYITKLKVASTPTVRLFNWNVIGERLNALKIFIDADIKQTILQGDLEMIVGILQDLYEKFHFQTAPKVKKVLDIEGISSTLADSETIEEFLIISLGDLLKLAPKQAQQLVADKFKLLTHVFVKGVKGDFTPLVQLLQSQYNAATRLSDLARDAEPDIEILLNYMRLPLFAPDAEVVTWALKLFAKLASDFTKHDLLFHLFQWLQISGFKDFIMTLQRQPQLAQQLALSLIQITNYDEKSIYSYNYFDNNKSMLQFYALLLPYLNCDLLSLGLESKMAICLKMLESIQRDDKTTAIAFGCIAWAQYPQYFELNPALQLSLCSGIQKAVKDGESIQRITTIVQSFKLLDTLASKKQIGASVLYKRLISMFMENPSEEMMFQIGDIIRKYPSIPLDPLIGAVLRILNYNLPFISLITKLAKHPNLQAEMASQVLDKLAQIYNTSIIFQSTIASTMQDLIRLFLPSNQFQEQLSKVATTSMTLFVQSLSNKEELLLNKQRRGLIIQWFRFVISLEKVNHILKPILVGAYLEIKNTRDEENKAIKSLLQLLGDPTVIVRDAIKDQSEKHSKANSLHGKFIPSPPPEVNQTTNDLLKSLLLEEEPPTRSLTTRYKPYGYHDPGQVLFEEGALPPPKIKYQLVDFSIEEDLQRESVTIAMKHFNKTLDYLFMKYALTAKQQAKARLNVDHQILKMKPGDLLRLLSDFEVLVLSSQQEIQHLLSLIDNQDTREHSLTVEQFKIFMVQFALAIFSRPPKDLRKMPAGAVIHEFFSYFQHVARRNNGNVLIFEDPHGITTVADSVTIAKWNQQLVKAPATVIPPETNLKKAHVQVQNFNFTMKRNVIDINESFLLCYEIVNDMIADKFKTQIIEPFTTVSVVYQVRPIEAKGIFKDATIDILLDKHTQLKDSMALLPEDKNKILNKSLDISTSEGRLNNSQLSKIANEFEINLKREIREAKLEKRKKYLDSLAPKIEQNKERERQMQLQKIALKAEETLQLKETSQPKHHAFIEKKREQLKTYKSEVFNRKEFIDQFEKERALSKERAKHLRKPKYPSGPVKKEKIEPPPPSPPPKKKKNKNYKPWLQEPWKPQLIGDPPRVSTTTKQVPEPVPSKLPQIKK